MSGASASIATSEASRRESGLRVTKWRMARAGEHRPPATPAIAGQGFDGGRFNRLAISCSRLS